MTSRMSDDGVARRAPTRVEIVAVPSTQISTLRNLFQFYEYDFSEIAWLSIHLNRCHIRGVFTLASTHSV